MRRLLRDLLPAALVLALAGALTLLAGCPVRRLFGVSCPLCGMGRACLCALRLDFGAAFRFHPLWPLTVPGLTAWVLAERRRPGRSKPIWLGLLLVLTGVYVFRIWKQDPVLLPDLPSGLVTGLFYK